MRKTILLLLSVATFLCVFNFHIVYGADSIIVEGENYAKTNFTPTITKNVPEFSNSAIMTLLQAYETDKEYEISYNVTVDKAGGYDLNAVSTILGEGFTCDYYVKINDDQLISSAQSAKLIKDVPSSTFQSIIKKYDLGFVQLKAGENTISFIVKDDIRSDNLVALYLDCFDLTYIPFGIGSVKANAPMGVFENNQSVEYNIEFVSPAENECSFSFKVSDFWSNSVVDRTFKVGAGAKKYKLNLGRFETGWYSLQLLQDDKVTKTTTFSVVQPQAKRTKEESPFAMDFASAWLVKTGLNDIRDYAKAAKLAGIQWVRERYSWGGAEPEQNKYYFDGIARTVDVLSGEGLKILNTFHDTPAWAVEKGYFPKDIFYMYNFQKNVAARFKGKVQAWEMWNEEDTAFASETADEYSAFLKAGAIGLADSGSDALKVLGGFAGSPKDTTYMDLCMQNGVMNYSDVYNYHNYGSDDNDRVPKIVADKMNIHMATSSAYDDLKQPRWVTEGGMALAVNADNNNIPTRAQLMSQARGNVIVNVQSIAGGTTKHFWFILPHYWENGREFGTFYETNNPFPAYSAEANMTYQLGKAAYKGRLANLPEGAEGHLFNNGKDDVAVVWSDNSAKIQVKTDSNVVVSDLMGEEKTVELCGENSGLSKEIDISQYPVYIRFNGECNLNNYYPCGFEVKKTDTHTFKPEDRIVLRQKFTGANYATPRTDGYTIFQNSPNKFVVEVNNFNQQEMKGTLEGTAETGFEISPKNADVTVPPMSKVDVEFNITADENVKNDVTSYLKFEGVFNGKSISPSVSRIISTDPKPVQPIALFPNSDNPDAWDVTNVTKYAQTSATKGKDKGEVVFKVDFKDEGGDRWFYPKLRVDDPSALKDTSGVCFNIYCEKTLERVGMHIFCYLSDNRWYFLGDDNRLTIKKGWNQVKMPWSKFILASSPLGVATDLRLFDQTLLKDISMGLNSSYNDVPAYIIKNFGYYTSNNEKSTIAAHSISINGVEEGGVYSSGQATNAVATLPENINFKNVKVMLMNKDYDKFKIDGNKVTVDLNGLPKGDYTLLVAAQTDMNYYYKQTVNFYINQ